MACGVWRVACGVWRVAWHRYSTRQLKLRYLVEVSFNFQIDDDDEDIDIPIDEDSDDDYESDQFERQFERPSRPDSRRPLDINRGSQHAR